MSLTEQQIAELKAAFVSFDKDMSGTIDGNDLSRLMKTFKKMGKFFQFLKKNWQNLWVFGKKKWRTKNSVFELHCSTILNKENQPLNLIVQLFLFLRWKYWRKSMSKMVSTLSKWQRGSPGWAAWETPSRSDWCDLLAEIEEDPALTTRELAEMFNVSHTKIGNHLHRVGKKVDVESGFPMNWHKTTKQPVSISAHFCFTSAKLRVSGIPF